MFGEPGSRRWLDLARPPDRGAGGAIRDLDLLTEQVPAPPDRLVAVLLAVALLGASGAVVALLVVLSSL